MYTIIGIFLKISKKVFQGVNKPGPNKVVKEQSDNPEKLIKTMKSMKYRWVRIKLALFDYSSPKTTLYSKFHNVKVI